MQIDKRSHKRVKGAGVVYYSDANPQKNLDKYEGQVVDISPGGICISTQYEFERGSKVRFYITEHYTGIFTGIVKRCIKSSDDKFNIGLEVPFSDDSNMH